MDDEEGGAPAEPTSAEPPPADLFPTVPVLRPGVDAPQPLAVFLGITVLVLASFGAAALALAGAGRVAFSEPEPTATPTVTSAPGRTAGAGTAAAAPGGRVRVVSSSGRSRPVANGTQHEVTFSWVLEGAREGDAVVVQFQAGSRTLGQQRGVLDPSVFSFSTGTLSLTATLDCATAGWTADILTIRGQPVEGEGEATVPGVACR